MEKLKIEMSTHFNINNWVDVIINNQFQTRFIIWGKVFNRNKLLTIAPKTSTGCFTKSIKYLIGKVRLFCVVKQNKIVIIVNSSIKFLKRKQPILQLNNKQILFYIHRVTDADCSNQ